MVCQQGAEPGSVPIATPYLDTARCSAPSPPTESVPVAKTQSQAQAASVPAPKSDVNSSHPSRARLMEQSAAIELGLQVRGGTSPARNIVILEADLVCLQKIHERTENRSVRSSIYIQDMFSTGNDEDNRKTVLGYLSSDLPIVGIGLREERKLVDKITKGAKLHP